MGGSINAKDSYHLSFRSLRYNIFAKKKKQENNSRGKLCLVCKYAEGANTDLTGQDVDRAEAVSSCDYYWIGLGGGTRDYGQVWIVLLVKRKENVQLSSIFFVCTYCISHCV